MRMMINPTSTPRNSIRRSRLMILINFPKSKLPLEIEFESDNARVLFSFSPEMESKANSRARKLRIIITTNDHVKA